MIQVILLWLIAFLASIMGVIVTIFEPTSKRAKVWYVIIFTLIGLASLPILIWQYSSTEQTNKKNKIQFDGLATDLRQSKNDLRQSNISVSNLQTEVSKLIYEFSTNSTILPAVRLAILDDQQEKIATQISEVQKRGILISVPIPDISTIRAERENRRQLKELQDRQREIQRAKEEIKQQEEQAKAQVAQQQEEQRVKEAAAKKESEATKAYLEIFDYTIRRLYTMIISFSKDSRESIRSDFPTGLPTAYNSSFVSEGHLVIGVNTIGIGTNAAWNFTISTVNESLVNTGGPGQIGWKADRWKQPLPFSLIIKSKRWPWNRSLEITPYDDCVSIKFGTRNKLDINDTPKISDYKTNIDAAITALLDSIDERSPLPTGTNSQSK